jgi:hypothetical protein
LHSQTSHKRFKKRDLSSDPLTKLLKSHHRVTIAALHLVREWSVCGLTFPAGSMGRHTRIVTEKHWKNVQWQLSIAESTSFAVTSECWGGGDDGGSPVSRKGEGSKSLD